MVYHKQKWNLWKRILRRQELYLIVFLIIVLSVFSYGLEFLRTELLIKDILREGINYDAFRELSMEEVRLEEAEYKISRIIKKYPELKELDYMNSTGYLTFSMLARSYDLVSHEVVDEDTFLRGIFKVADTTSFKELYGYYKAILSDLRMFPVPAPKAETPDITYGDTWHVLRRYGGNRTHEGCDLMASNNIRGYFPVISVTDGFVEKIGWLEKGGYRIGIRASSGGYFYYAHLDSYAPELKQGDRVIAGQLLGFMGDSGYGEEGTEGKFDVHLHLGIYVDTLSGEMSVNPYRILHILQKNRTSYEYP